MKKLLLIALTGIALFLGVSFAGFTEFTTTPADQYAISGTLVSRSMHVHNSTGTAYLKAVLPHAGAYDLAYQSASITPINNALLSLGAEHDPIFLINS